MTAVLEAPAGGATRAPLLPLPSRFPAQMTDCDEPVHGDLRETYPRTARRSRLDPIALLPGDYILGEGDAPWWLRVDFASHGRTGTWVCTTSGLRVFVPAGREKWVWRAADVLVWAVLGEDAGGAL